MPWLIGLYDANGELKAASGVHIASQGSLYLEKYLDSPIEVTLSSRLSQSVSRAAIVEIGNFAARDGKCTNHVCSALPGPY
jgi:hypothetical protein